MLKPDYSQYLAENFLTTDADWIEHPEIHDRQIEAVKDMLARYDIRSILEIGSGAGHLAARIPSAIKYTGVDSCEIALKKAQERKPGGRFICGDIRAVDLPQADLVVCFAFLKHFELSEWGAIAARVARAGRYCVFDIPVSIHRGSYDDGPDFPHVWITPNHVRAVLESAGCRILELDDRTIEWVYYVSN